MKPSAAALLVAQAVCLGLVLANLVVPGSAVFLEIYGSARLPFVYLLVAGTGSAVSALVHRLQSRYGLYQLAVGTTAVMATAAALFWGLLAVADLPWAAFAVLTLFSVQLQLGFVFIGAQAGRAFDVQRIKRVFPRIVGGFVFGFMVGGFLAAPLLAALGRAEHLVAVAAILTATLATLTAATSSLVPTPEPVDQRADGLPSSPRPTLRKLLAVPLVAAVFAYQVLSATGTQLIEYLVYDRAAARYSGAEELASFMGRFTALLNLADLVVLLLIGSLLMARYGLRFGVAANPVVVTGLVAVAVVVSIVAGTDSTALFLLVGVARITDLTLADVATRTSVNATFQVLPPQQRLAAQVGVEGAGVPLALGLTAALVLIINAAWASPVVPVIAATAVVCALWCLLSLVVYRRYRDATVVAARRRLLDDVRVDLSEPATRAALLQLAASDSPTDVAKAVELLTARDDQHPNGRAGTPGRDIEEVEQLIRDLAASDDLAVRHTVLRPLVDRDPARALAIAVECAGSDHAGVRLDGLRALGRLGGGVATAHLAEVATDDDHSVRATALGVLIAAEGPGSPSVRMVDDLAASTSPDDRALAAISLGEAGSRALPDRLVALLGDESHQVRAAAATAVTRMPHDRQSELFALVVQRRRSIGAGRPDHAIEAFFRGCAGTAGPATCGRVADWLADDDTDAGTTTRGIRFLISNGWRFTGSTAAIDHIITRQVEVVGMATDWSQRVGGGTRTPTAGPEPLPATGDPIDRLGRALQAERRAGQRRLIEALTLVYDRRLMQRVARLWSDPVTGQQGAKDRATADRADRAMAGEALDLTLAPRHRADVLQALADAPQARNGGEPAPLETVELLARSAGWAAEPDWLQATAVAVLRHDARWQPGDLEPLGPITAELLVDARR